VECHLPGPQPAETLWLPMHFLADCEAKNDQPVELEAAGKGRCAVRWRDGSVPQIVQYESVKPADLAKFVEHVWRAIEAGHFYPAPSAMNCPACPFRDACRAW